MGCAYLEDLRTDDPTNDRSPTEVLTYVKFDVYAFAQIPQAESWTAGSCVSVEEVTAATKLGMSAKSTVRKKIYRLLEVCGPL